MALNFIIGEVYTGKAVQSSSSSPSIPYEIGLQGYNHITGVHTGMAIVTIWLGPSTKRHNLATPAEGSPTSDVFQNHKPFFCSPHSPAACAFTALALASIKQPDIGLLLGCQSAFFLSAILPSCHFRRRSRRLHRRRCHVCGTGGLCFRSRQFSCAASPAISSLCSAALSPQLKCHAFAKMWQSSTHHHVHRIERVLRQPCCEEAGDQGLSLYAPSPRTNTRSLSFALLTDNLLIICFQSLCSSALIHRLLHFLWFLYPLSLLFSTSPASHNLLCSHPSPPHFSCS